MTRTKAAKVTVGVFASLIREFIDSDKFKGYSANTQEAWGRELKHMEAPDALGAAPLKDIRPSVVQEYFDNIADRPGKQHNAYSVLVQLERWAIVRDKLGRQIMLGVDFEGSDGGHKPWEDDLVTLAEANAIPELSRAITLAVHTGQRRSDLVRMRWSDIETLQGHPGIHVTQQKTGRKLWIPFTEGLRAAMSTWKRRPGHILLRPTGIAWTGHALTQAWTAARRENPVLKPLDAEELVIHGLRASCCMRLSRKGLTDHQIGDMIGMSPGMVSRYTRFSRQQKNALAAIGFLQNRP